MKNEPTISEIEYALHTLEAGAKALRRADHVIQEVAGRLDHLAEIEKRPELEALAKALWSLV